MIFYNFGRPFFGHHNYLLNLSDLCTVVEKIFKDIKFFFIYDLNGHALKQESLHHDFFLYFGKPVLSYI